MDRREFLKTGLSFAGALTGATYGLSSAVNASGSAGTAQQNLSRTLANALRSIGSKRCIAAAEELEASNRDDGGVRLHLRNAGLNASDVLTIAHALKSVSRKEASSLASLSFSYNEAIGDAGVVTLAQALPAGLRELGLVGCGIGDQGGEALLQWASHAQQLSMICIEQNNFSEPMREQFNELARTNTNLLLVV